MCYFSFFEVRTLYASRPTLPQGIFIFTQGMDTKQPRLSTYSSRTSKRARCPTTSLIGQETGFYVLDVLCRGGGLLVRASV